MKIKASEYGRIKRDVVAVADHYGLDHLKQAYRPSQRMGAMWDLFWRAASDWADDGSHPRYRMGIPRLARHRPGWDMYANGLNDAHYETALRRIGRELGLL